MAEGSSMEFLFETNADQTLPAIAKALTPAIEALEELRALGDFEIGGGLADGFAELPGQADKAISKVQDSLRRLASGTDLSGIGREIGGSLRELQDVLGKVESAGGSRMQLVTGMEQALRAGRELLSVVREINQAGTRPQTYGAVSTALGAAHDRNMALGSGRVIDGEVVARSDQRLADENTRQADVRRQGTQVEQRLNQVNERLIQEKEAETRRIAERAQQSTPFSHPPEAQPTPRTGAPAASPFLPEPPARPAAAPTGTPVAPFSNPQVVPTSPARPDVAPRTDPFSPAEQQFTQSQPATVLQPSTTSATDEIEAAAARLEENLANALSQAAAFLPHERRVTQEPDSPQRRASDEGPPVPREADFGGDLEAFDQAVIAYQQAVHEALQRGQITLEEATRRAQALESHGEAGFGIGNIHQGRFNNLVPLPDELYHVTTAKDAVLREGLKTPLERNPLAGTDAAGSGASGLGGGPPYGLSLTGDAQAAQGIKDALVQANSLLRGETSLKDLMRQARQGGFADEWASIEGAKSPLALSRKFGRFEKQVREGDYSEDDATGVRFGHYQSFLRARHQTGQGVDPVFFGGSSSAIRDLDPSQIDTLRLAPAQQGLSGYRPNAKVDDPLAEIEIVSGRLVKVLGTLSEAVEREQQQFPHSFTGGPGRPWGGFDAGSRPEPGQLWPGYQEGRWPENAGSRQFVVGASGEAHVQEPSPLTAQVRREADERARALSEQAIADLGRTPVLLDHPNRVPEGIRDYSEQIERQRDYETYHGYNLPKESFGPQPPRPGGLDNAGSSAHNFIPQDEAALNGHSRAVETDTETLIRSADAAKEFINAVAGGNGNGSINGHGNGNGHGGSGGDGDDGGDGGDGGKPKGRFIDESELSKDEVVRRARTGEGGVRQIGNSGAYILPEYKGAYRYESGGKVEGSDEELPGGWKQVVDAIEKQQLANTTKPYELGPEGEEILGDYRKLDRRPISGFDWTETTQSQNALAQRVKNTTNLGYDKSLGYDDFEPVKGSTTLFRDLNGELLRLTGDLATYATTLREQIQASRALTETELHRVEVERGQNIAAGLPGFERIGPENSKFFNTPQGAPAFMQANGRATIDLNASQQRGAQKAQEDADRATQEKATADRIYSQAVRNSTRLNNIAQKNPADELRDLGSGYSQLGETLFKRTQNGLRLIQGEQELYEASLGLARTLEKQGRAHVDQNVWQSFMGGAFGHGFESNQQFKPQDALKNLAGTAGVLARYGGEGRLLFGAVGGLNDTVKQYEEYQKVLVDLKATQEALADAEGQAVNTHVNLNEAYKVGAEYGMNEVDSIQAGIGGLKAFSEELKNGKSASDIFTQSVQAAGVAAVLTGKSAAEIQPTQNAISNEFQLGSGGLGRVNDAAANAGRHFNVPLDRIYSGMQASGDIAGLGGFDPERLGATVAAVDDYTGKDSGAQIARELAQGGSARFRTAVGNLGVQYDAKDVSGTLAKAGEAYKGLDDAQKAAFATQLGGARTAEVVIALLQQQAKVAETTAAGYRDQGKALQEAHDKQATFGGELSQLRALLQDLATDLGKLGLIDAFGGVLELISPIVRGVDDLARVLDKIPGPVKDIIFAWGALRGLQGLGGGVGLLGTTNMMGRHNPGYLPGVAPRTGRQNARRGFRRITGRNMDPNAPKESAKETAEKQHTVDVEADTKATVDHTASVVADTGAAKAEAEADALATKSAQDLAAANAQAAEATEKRTIADTTATEATERRALADDEGALSGAASGLRGFTGGASGLMGAGILATFGYGMVRDTWDKTSGILNTKNTAEADTQDARYTGSAADLRSDASKANTDAQNAAVASGGVTGTILNWLTGGNGAAIKQARATATRQNDLAGELDKIDAEGTQNGVGASLDISSPDSLDASLKALQATGASTADVVDALGGALDTMAKSGKGALGTLNPTDVKEMAARGGSAAKGSVAGAISSAEDEGLGKGHGFGWRDLIPGVGVVDVAKWAGDKAGGIGNIAPQIGRTTGSVKQRRDSAKHDLKSLKNVKQDDVQKVASTAVQDYLTDNPSYDPKTDQNGLADYIDQMLANNNVGLSDKEVDPNTRHQIALDVARTVQGAASAKVDGANTTSATVQAAFNDAVTADAAKSGTVGSLAGIGQYTGAAQVGDTAGVAAAREKLADDKKALEDAKAWRGKDGKGLSASQIADDEAKVADDQVALNSALNAQIGDQIKINQSHRALSDTLGRGLDNIAGLQQQLDQAKATGNPHDVAVAQAAVDDANKQQAVDTAATQAAGMGIGINDTTTGVSTGNTPSFDPRDTLGNAQRGLAGDTFTFNQLDGAEKGMAQHSQQWIDAFKKLQEDKHEIAVIELNAANAAIDAAALPGDAMGAAADAIAKAKNTLDSTLPGTPEHDAAVAAQNAAGYAARQAGAEWQNALNSSSATPGDDVSAAGTAQGNAKNLLDAATKYGKDGQLTTDYLNKLAAYKATIYATGQAIVTQSNAEATAKVFPGDALGAAQTQVQTLTATLTADAYHSTKWWQDWGALQAAKVATIAAEIDAASVAQTLRSDTTDPVAMARIAADKARAKTAADAANPNLRGAARTRILNADTVSERQAQNAQERAGFDQWLSDTKINMELGRTSFATYMQLLEGRDSMLKAERARMKVGSDGYRRLTDEINTTEQTIHDAMNQLSGQFNLGDIKMPTLYEVRRSNATAQAGTGYNDNRSVSIVINGVGSTQEVVQIVKQQLGTAATVTKGPTTTRKV